ncbi:MAG: EAL domain-containing protein, partial [Myxococcota bacterium]|nr:EAL domain-containing protein [Myxococcota bacterium]
GFLVGVLGLMALNVVAIRRGGSVRLSAHVAMAALFASLWISAYQGAGFVDPALSWFVLVPLAAALWMDLRAAVQWMLVCAVGVVALWALDGAGLGPPDAVDPRVRSGFRLTGQLLALPTVVALAAVFLRAQRGLERSLRESHARIRDMALYDPLTRLPNRRFFRERLAAMLEDASRRGRPVALLFVDLDGFKSVNDALGHAVGDALLREVSGRLRAVVRPTDTVTRAAAEWEDERLDDASVSRLGGDEFIVVLDGIAGAEDVVGPAERLLDTLRAPLRVHGHEVSARASIGVAIHPQDGTDVETLLRRADLAMYDAKARGRNTVRFYSAELDRAAQSRVRLEERLRRALERDELELHYQPICDARTGGTVGAEALLRWNDAELGPVSPAEFIAVAEQSGLVGRIDRWVFDRACAQVESWRREGLRPVRVGVNVSGRHLGQREFADEVRAALRRHRGSPALLELEITESTVMSDDPITRETLTRLHELGLGLVLDDFGTGFSSLSHLRNCPVQRLKIDRSFVAGLLESSHDRAIVESLVALARSLRVGVVAEGVETEAQREALLDLGCEEIQGWLVSPAVPPAAFTRFLRPEKDA